MEEQNNNLYIDEINEAEAFAYKSIFVFDKNSGKSIEIEVNSEKDLEISNSELSDIEKILQELVERKNIKSLTVSIHLQDKEQVYKSNDALGISREDTVNKIKEAIKEFKDIVIVYSRKELEDLQRQFREENNLGINDNTDKTVSDNKTLDKSYNKVRLDFINQIKNNENLSKGYIRISNEDYANLGDMLEKYEMPYLSKESNIKDGVNIIVPIEKVDELKSLFSQNGIECKQIVHGNIDWRDIKDTKNIYEYVSKDELKKFQQLNNDNYKYIAFENKNKFSVYLEKECDISIVGRKKSIDRNKQSKKTLIDVKKEVETQKQNSNNQKYNEKIKGEKER